SSAWTGSAWPLRGLGIGVAAAAAAALVVVATVSWPSSYGTPDLVQGETTTLATTEVIDLGPSIDLMPRAVQGYESPRVHVAAASASGTIVDVLEGGTRFEVDPKGQHRDLTVRAGDVAVHVRGTIFSVDHLDDGVEVFVERGKVQVDSPEGTLYLTAGQRWHSGDGLVSLGEPGKPASLGIVEPFVEPEAPEDVVPIEEPPAEPVVTPAPRAPVAAKDPPALDTPDAGSSEPADTEPQGIPESAAGPWVTTETVSAAEIVQKKPPTRQTDAGLADDAPTTSRSQLALPELLKLRKRFSAGESSRTLLQDVDAFVRQSGEADLLPMAMELRVDVSRRDGTRLQFERAVLGLLQHNPKHPDRGRLLVETGRRWMQADEIQRALAAFKLAAAIPNNDGIHGLIGIADCEGTLGRPKEARAALSEALRIVADPDLEEELRARLQRLDRH
ncbi:MAG: FecR domain-containing protein, partial [Myxococcota bacterium]